jgi:hypothetical protein
MNPPAPGPVSGDSATNDISTQSTALPPDRSTSAPASAVTGWPAATTPLIGASLARRVGQPRGTNSGTSTSDSMPAVDRSRDRLT